MVTSPSSKQFITERSRAKEILKAYKAGHSETRKELDDFVARIERKSPTVCHATVLDFIADARGFVSWEEMVGFYEEKPDTWTSEYLPPENEPSFEPALVSRAIHTLAMMFPPGREFNDKTCKPLCKLRAAHNTAIWLPMELYDYYDHGPDWASIRLIKYIEDGTITRQDKHLTSDEDWALLHAVTGHGRYHFSRTDEALEEYQKGISIKPDAWILHTFAARCKAAKRNHKEAIETYSMVLAKLPESALTYALRSLSYAETGRYNLAMTDIEKAIEVEEEKEQRWRWLRYKAQFHLLREEYKEAVSCCNTVIRQGWHRNIVGRARRTRAKAKYRLNQKKQAFLDQLRARHWVGDDPYCHFAHLDTERRWQKVRKEHQTLEAAISQGSDNTQKLLQLAWTALELDDPVTMVGACTRILATDNGNLEALSLRALAHIDRKDKKHAKQDLEDLLQLGVQPKYVEDAIKDVAYMRKPYVPPSTNPFRDLSQANTSTAH